MVKLEIHEEYEGDWQGVSITSEDGRSIWRPWLSFSHDHAVEEWKKEYEEEVIVADCDSQCCGDCNDG